MKLFQKLSTCSFHRPVSQQLLTPSQFTMCFRQAKPDEVERHQDNVGLFSPSQYIVVGGPDAVVPECDRRLVLAYWTQDRKLMILRRNPVVMDTSKFSLDQEHNRLYGELLMFRHWNNEDLFLGTARQSKEACLSLYRNERTAINEVAEGLRQLLCRMI